MEMHIVCVVKKEDEHKINVQENINGTLVNKNLKYTVLGFLFDSDGDEENSFLKDWLKSSDNEEFDLNMNYF